MEQAKLDSEKFKTQPAIEHLSINPRELQKSYLTRCIQHVSSTRQSQLSKSPLKHRMLINKESLWARKKVKVKDYTVPALQDELVTASMNGAAISSSKVDAVKTFSFSLSPSLSNSA